MPQIVCPCGITIDLSQILAPAEWIYLGAGHWDAMIESISAAVSKQVHSPDPIIMKEAISDAIAGFVRSFYMCPQCGRLLFSDHLNNFASEYVRSSGGGSPAEEAVLPKE